MRVRALSATVYVTVFAAALIAGDWIWAGFVALLATLGTAELYALARAGGRRPAGWIGLLLAPAIVAATLFERRAWPSLNVDPSADPDISLLPALLAIAIMAAFVAQIARRESDRSIDDWAATLACPLYAGLLLSFLVALRQIPGDRGLVWTTVLLALVWINDTAAYLVGRAIGRRPWFPSLSPRKTAEGAIGGMVASVVLGVAAPALGTFMLGTAVGGPWSALAAIAPWQGAVVGCLAGVAAPIGDLSESLLKRQVGAKDSGRWIPGHGGILDRVDSIAFAAPVVYFAARWLGF